MTGRDPLPRHTTPTWEMELLISGATVFALLQLPGVLDELFYAYFPRFQRPYAEMVMLPYLYVKTAVYALILTFILHLAMRGYWVALVGLRSVYGEGVQWDKLRWGPGYLRVLRERTPPVDVLVERADNRASLVFSYGIALALVTLAPLLMVGMVAVVTWAVHLLLGGRVAWQTLWTVLLIATMAPLFGAVFFDRWFGKRLQQEGRLARGLRGVFSGYLRIGMSSASTYPLLVFVSRAGQKRAGVAMFVAVTLMFGLTFAQLMAREGDLDLGSYGDLALGEAGAARALRNEHYADTRGKDLSATSPFIPSQVVRGDWLRLFVPFRPGRDSRAFEDACEPVAAAAPDPALHDLVRERLAADAARTRVLECLARAYAPALDGVSVAGVRFDAAEDAATGLRGAVAMLPIAHLAPGRHELTVERLPSQVAKTDDPPPPPHRIVFWR